KYLINMQCCGLLHARRIVALLDRRRQEASKNRVYSPTYSGYVNPKSEVVSGYVTSRGTVVNSYHRTLRDGDPWNNYSTKGRQNPWNGKWGAVNPANR
ncbi:MAG: hypothetical protein K2Z81_19840, partial [Cyanobacteria bacterium]|nr:hypothetical protein [Cyanobacteriota bacterium]